MDKEIFAQRFKQLRENIDITQKELASKLGVKRSTVGSWESAHRWPEIEKAQQAAEIFGVSVDYLLGRTNNLNSHIESKKQQEINNIYQAKTLSDALQKIIQLDIEFNLDDETMLRLIRKARDKYNLEYKNTPKFNAADKEKKYWSPSFKDDGRDYSPDIKNTLEELVPKNEINLAEAMVKVSNITAEHNLSKEDATYLMHRVVDYYGKPEFPEDTNEAAHGPASPGQIDWNKNRNKDE